MTVGDVAVGGGVLVMVTVVLSGVTMVNVMDFGASAAVTTGTSSVVVATGPLVADSVVSEDVNTSNPLIGSSVVVVVEAAVKPTRLLVRPELNKEAVVLIRPDVLPARKDSKLLTTVASETVSSSSPKLSSQSAVVASVVVVVAAIVVAGTASVVKEKATGANELRAKTAGFNVLLR